MWADADKQHDYFLSILRKGNQHIQRNLFVSDGTMESIDTTFSLHARLSVLRTKPPHLQWNLFVFDGLNGLHRNNFQPLLMRLDNIFLSVLQTETDHMSGGIYSCLLEHLLLVYFSPTDFWFPILESKWYPMESSWQYWTTLNSQPSGPESDALTTEPPRLPLTSKRFASYSKK